MGGSRSSGSSRIGFSGGGGIALISRTDDMYREIELTSSELATEWDVSPEELEAVTRESLGTPSTKEAFIYSILRRWTGSSGSAESVIMMDAVARRLGLSYDAYDRNVLNWAKDNPLVGKPLERLGNLMYDRTQNYFRERGITHLELGRKGSPAENRLMSSWSTEWSGIRHEGGGTHIRAWIPVKQIFSIPATGFGNRIEAEVVLLPGRRSTRLLGG